MRTGLWSPASTSMLIFNDCLLVADLSSHAIKWSLQAVFKWRGRTTNWCHKELLPQMCWDDLNSFFYANQDSSNPMHWTTVCKNNEQTLWPSSKHLFFVQWVQSAQHSFEIRLLKSCCCLFFLFHSNDSPCPQTFLCKAPLQMALMDKVCKQKISAKSP